MYPPGESHFWVDDFPNFPWKVGYVIFVPRRVHSLPPGLCVYWLGIGTELGRSQRLAEMLRRALPTFDWPKTVIIWVVVSNIFIFTPTWGRFPFWLIFFKGVGSTTNQQWEVNEIRWKGIHIWAIYNDQTPAGWENPLNGGETRNSGSGFLIDCPDTCKKPTFFKGIYIFWLPFLHNHGSVKNGCINLQQ